MKQLDGKLMQISNIGSNGRPYGQKLMQISNVGARKRDFANARVRQITNYIVCCFACKGLSRR
jgi:hypothetical protein